MKITWSRTAIADLSAMRAYIEEHNPTAAAKTARRLVEAVEGLLEFPAQGRPGRLPQTRELVVSGTPYFIPYRINDDRLEIIAVIHGARQWPESTT